MVSLIVLSTISNTSRNKALFCDARGDKPEFLLAAFYFFSVHWYITVHFIPSHLLSL